MLNFKEVILLLQNDYCVEYNGSLIISFFDDDSFGSGDGAVIIEFDNEEDEVFDPEAVGKIYRLDEITLYNDIHYLSKIIKTVEDYYDREKDPKFIFVSLDNIITHYDNVIESLFEGSFNYSIKKLTEINSNKIPQELKYISISNK